MSDIRITISFDGPAADIDAIADAEALDIVAPLLSKADDAAVSRDSARFDEGDGIIDIEGTLCPARLAQARARVAILRGRA